MDILQGKTSLKPLTIKYVFFLATNQQKYNK